MALSTHCHAGVLKLLIFVWISAQSYVCTCDQWCELQNDEKDKLRASLGNAIMVERPDVKVSTLWGGCNLLKPFRSMAGSSS